jgi:hypothetical protein
VAEARTECEDRTQQSSPRPVPHAGRPLHLRDTCAVAGDATSPWPFENVSAIMILIFVLLRPTIGMRECVWHVVPTNFDLRYTFS